MNDATACPNTDECGEKVMPVVTEDSDGPVCPCCGAAVFRA